MARILITKGKYAGRLGIADKVTINGVVWYKTLIASADHKNLMFTEDEFIFVPNLGDEDEWIAEWIAENVSCQSCYEMAMRAKENNFSEEVIAYNLAQSAVCTNIHHTKK